VKQRCPYCSGDGETLSGYRCPDCDGTGQRCDLCLEPRCECGGTVEYCDDCGKVKVACKCK
jgi:hypothetical protein